MNRLRDAYRFWTRGTSSRKLAWGLSLSSIGSFITTAVALWLMIGAKIVQPSASQILGVLLVFAGVSFGVLVYSRKFLFALLLNVLCFAALQWLLLTMGPIMFAFSSMGTSHRHMDRVVAPSELQGTWTPTEQTLDFLFLSERYYLSGEPHFIELNADGSARFRSFKDGARSRESRFGYFRGEGSWELLPKEAGDKHSYQRLELTLEGELWPITQTYYLAERRGRIFLWTSIGDPFAFDYLEHVKNAPADH